MALSMFFALLGACAVIALTPGAGAVNTMSTSLRAGWTRTVWTVLGQEAALALQLLVTALGLGLLIASHPGVLLVIRILGALYLAYLGIRLLLERPEADDDGAAAVPHSARQLLLRGFAVNMTNPKAILFFLAFVPQFIDPSRNLPVQYGIVMATILVVDIIVMWGFFATAAKAMNRLTHSARGLRRLNLVFGCLFLLMAALVALMPAR